MPPNPYAGACAGRGAGVRRRRRCMYSDRRSGARSRCRKRSRNKEQAQEAAASGEQVQDRVPQQETKLCSNMSRPHNPAQFWPGPAWLAAPTRPLHLLVKKERKRQIGFGTGTGRGAEGTNRNAKPSGSSRKLVLGTSPGTGQERRIRN